MTHGAGGERVRLNVAVGGPQGIGKSTTLRFLARHRPDVRILSAGDRFPGGFRSMERSERDRIRAQVTSDLCEELAAGRGVTVVDLHFLDRAEPGLRIQPPALLALLDVRLVLVAPPEVLHARRRDDQERLDRSVDLAEARRDVEAHLAYVANERSPTGPVLLVDATSSPGSIAAAIGDHIDRWLRPGESG